VGIVVVAETACWIGLVCFSKVGNSSSPLELLDDNVEGVLGVDSDDGFGEGVLCVVKFTGPLD
jgi:hypothetical protein